MSVNVHNDVGNHYYSGQGVVMIGQRDAQGNAGALFPLGNCTALKIGMAASTTDHKNAQDGVRAMDKRLVTEIKGTISFDLENLIARNLAIATRGAFTIIPAGVVSAGTDTGYMGAVGNLAHMSVTSLVMTNGTPGWTSGVLTEYVDDATAWDYKWNADAGSYKLNSGTETVAPVKLSIALTGTPVGTITASSLAITGLTAWPGYAASNSPLAVNDTVSLWGVTGAGAASVNGIAGTITAISATTLTVTIPGSAGAVVLATTTLVVPITKASTGQPFPVTLTAIGYNYAAQNRVDTLTLPPQEMFLRFEGLNTADPSGTSVTSFNPVVVEVYKFSVDPLKELDLISDTIGKMTIEGAILADSTKTTGSKYFHVKQMY